MRIYVIITVSVKKRWKSITKLYPGITYTRGKAITRGMAFTYRMAYTRGMA